MFPAASSDFGDVRGCASREVDVGEHGEEDECAEDVGGDGFCGEDEEDDGVEECVGEHEGQEAKASVREACGDADGEGGQHVAPVAVRAMGEGEQEGLEGDGKPHGEAAEEVALQEATVDEFLGDAGNEGCEKEEGEGQHAEDGALVGGDETEVVLRGEEGESCEHARGEEDEEGGDGDGEGGPAEGVKPAEDSLRILVVGGGCGEEVEAEGGEEEADDEADAEVDEQGVWCEGARRGAGRGAEEAVHDAVDEEEERDGEEEDAEDAAHREHAPDAAGWEMNVRALRIAACVGAVASWACVILGRIVSEAE